VKFPGMKFHDDPFGVPLVVTNVRTDGWTGTSRGGKRSQKRGRLCSCPGRDPSGVGRDETIQGFARSNGGRAI